VKTHGGTSLTPGRQSGDKSAHRSPQGKAKKNGAGVSGPEPVLTTGVSGERAGKKDQPKILVIPRPLLDEPAHQGSAGRPFWSGSITIGLVNVPVRLHTMVRDRSFSFRLLHREDGQPLRYDRVCTKDGRVIPWADTVKGYEVRKGEYVVFEPDELKAVMPESDRKIRIEKFVYYLSLDPTYFETPYILVPDRSEEAYSLLITALQDLGRAAVGTITLRTKEYPVVVHVYKGGLVLTTLRHADEVTSPQAFDQLTSLPAPKERELTLAKRIINELSGDFSIMDYPDRYQEAVMRLIEKKLAGEKIVHVEPHPEEAKELMQALQETIATLARK
jgi:DNA end-binding protein Ku